MKNLSCLFLLILAQHSCIGQANRDSLMEALTFAKEDTNKVLLLFALGDSYESSSPDSALYYVHTAKTLSTKLNFEKGILKSYRSLAYAHVVQSRYDSLLHYSMLALELARANKDTFNIGVSLFNIGIAYRFMSDLESAVTYSLEGAHLLEGKGYTRIESPLYDGLQVLYMTLAKYDQAIVYGEKACAAARLLQNDNALGVALNNLSLSYMEVDQLDKAKNVLEEAIRVSRKVDNKSVEAAALNNLGDIAIREGKTSLVKAFCERSLILHRALGAVEGVAVSLRGLAVYHMSVKDYVKAAELAKEALKITRDNELFMETSQCLKVLSSIAFSRQDFNTGQQYFLESQKLEGKIFNESLQERESMLKVKYETQQKELKIQELEAEKKVDQFEMQNRGYLNYFLVGATLTLLVVSLLSYRNYRQKQKLQQQRIAELETEKKLMATEAVLAGEEQERIRLAKDLHDGLGGMLSGIKYSFGTMKGNLVMTPENHQAFERSMDMLDSSIKEMRRVAHNMMPETLVRFGLDTALKDFCKDINQSGALKVRYQSIGLEHANLEQSVAIAIYRIVQELVGNVMKHAAAKSAIVQVTQTENRVDVTVEDDGKGFDVNLLQQAKGIGWTNIQHRVNFLKGKLDIHSSSDKGTSVHIEFEK